MRYRVIKSIMALAVVVSTLLSGCITNDIPYPYVELYITGIEGEGFTLRTIDNTTRTVYISLDETTDIEDVTITHLDYTDGAILSNSLIGTFNMEYPLTTTLYLYQSYEWSVVAEQNITYEFSVEGQIGDARIDTDTRVVEVDVNNMTVDLSSVTVTSMKLGADGVTTYSPTLEELSGTNFSSVRRVKVTSHNRSAEWDIYVYAVEPIPVLSVSAWGRVAWLSASGDTTDPTDCGFAYREVGDEDWRYELASSASSGVFSLCVEGLTPQQRYEFIAYSGELESESIFAQMESTPELENGDFEEWSYLNDKTWFPYIDTPWWSSGNEGATYIGSTNTTTPSSDTPSSSLGDLSANIASKKIVIQFAAGSIFVGRYVETIVVGGDGIIALGRPFTQRPLGLDGWVKYNRGLVNYTSTEVPSVSTNDPDRGIVYVALGDWDPAIYGVDADGDILGDEQTPYIVDTRDAATFFNKDSDAVIAYGEALFESTTDGWIELKIDLEYRDYDRIPTHIIIVGTSSFYGDYYVGSTDSEMWLDDLTLRY